MKSVVTVLLIAAKYLHHSYLSISVEPFQSVLRMPSVM